MLFVESDAPLIKAWIVKRLEDNSDADADVLADYVLALLRHDGDVETIRKLFEEEIPDFLREDAAAFTDDVLQAVQYRSYLPGAPPPPPVVRQTQFLSAAARTQVPPRPELQPSIPAYHPSASYPAPPTLPLFPQGDSRKRSYSDRDDNDVDIILTSQTPYSQPYKQPRRGGGFNQRGGRYDDPYGPRSYQGLPPFTGPPGPVSFGAAHGFGQPRLDANSIMENIQLLQSLLPSAADLPKPIYSGTALPPRRRKQRCRDYDTKGYCSRGSNCFFEHGADPLYIPPPNSAAVDEYDPNNATLSMPPLGPQPPAAMPPLDIPPFQVPPPINRNESKKSRRTRGRAPCAANGPVHDKSKTTIVVQNIPSEDFSEDQVRGYFAQFGNIVDVSMEDQNRLAMIKFDSWDAAHAAWSSPKVIFDNRFVKVYWYKDETSNGITSNGKPAGGATNGHTDGATPKSNVASVEPDFDVDEFNRKQAEAQKVYDEKMKKRQEIDRERQELKERQKELRARQEEAKRQLQAKLKENDTRDGSSSPAEILTESKEKGPSTQTEALRAQLAALEQEANQLGIDPDDAQNDSLSWTFRGRGRGRGYRGRGTFPLRAIRGSYGYRGRGGTVEARHAAYAAYSLDNRPKIIALSGIDFTTPENDEALRQYLFSVGEFKEVHTASAVTHITFKDRKTAEKFMFGVSANNSIPGIEGKTEPTWVKTAPETPKAAANGDVPMASTLEDDQTTKEKTDTGDGDANGGLEEGEISNTDDHDQGDMDYEAGEW
ncbi:hypothetical protein F5Y19DRAFT_428573 [Xylariaceae sp. FL1651]|nr:hypothetical protein F5Y19DRAFT_428573 [Xylariaceae sp. FL1651]